MNTRVVVVLPENSPDSHSIAAQIADAIDCSVFTARGIRAALSLIAREKPEIAIFEEQFTYIEGRPATDLIGPISPATQVVFVNMTGHKSAGTTAAGE